MNQPVISKDLRITEIFYSLQGETTLVGLPTVFIRLTGCPLRCQYCDTEYAFTGGRRMSIASILNVVAHYNPNNITVTGGEPLAQPACLTLLTALCDQQYRVSLETSGALDVSQVDPRVIKIIDLKTPGSLELKRNDFNNLNYLQPHDQIKFVICDKNDYGWAKQITQQYDLNNKVAVLFSPSYQELAGADLAEWILQDNLQVRFQQQLHKSLWNDEPGR
jgi:7-carboxy-7-deazaguanine synthase